MKDKPNNGWKSDKNLPQAQEADDIEEVVQDEVQRAVQQAMEAHRTSQANLLAPLATVLPGRHATEPEGDDDSTMEDNEKVKICGFPKWLFYLLVIAVVAAIIGGIVAAVLSGESDTSSSVLATDEPPSISPTTMLTPSMLVGLLYPGRQLEDLLPAQHDAIKWIVEDDTFLLNPAEVTQELRERYALATIHFGMDGGKWTKTTNWLSRISHCEWDFVGCDEKGSVNSTQLGSLGLRGSLPAEIGWLSYLVELNFSRNDVTGKLPTELYDLTMLTLMHVSGNQITDSLDKSIGRLTSLRELHCRYNKIQGHIPSEIGMLSQLERVEMGQNLFSGEIPTHISGWKSAKFIYLQSNRLTGFPSEFGSLEQLEELSLSDNVGLNSTIPTKLARATNLKALNLHNTTLYGTIPVELENLKALLNMNLAFNLLSGSIPEEIGSWQQVTSLYLQGNGLQNSIPTTIGNLRSLEFLNMGQNDLSGRIPTEIGNLSILKYLTINDNQHITGPIPSTLGHCRDLLRLQMNNNSLTSTIPSQLSNIVTLSMLNLKDNKLSGSVPSSLNVLRRYIREVYLSGNNLKDGLENLFCNPTYALRFEADCLSKLVCNCCTLCT